eukprot:scaffold11716_cov112-Isochrysis_galbana.AAC.5
MEPPLTPSSHLSVAQTHPIHSRPSHASYTIPLGPPQPHSQPSPPHSQPVPDTAGLHTFPSAPDSHVRPAPLNPIHSPPHPIHSLPSHLPVFIVQQDHLVAVPRAAKKVELARELVGALVEHGPAMGQPRSKNDLGLVSIEIHVWATGSGLARIVRAQGYRSARAGVELKGQDRHLS